MRYLILFALPIFAATERVILLPDNCNIIMISGDQPGVKYETVGRVCTLPSKAEWAKANGLDTTVTDTTGRK